MKKALAALLFIILILSQAHYASASTLLQLSFDSMRVNVFQSGTTVEKTNGTWVKLGSFVVTLPSEVYLNGVTVNWKLSYDVGPNGQGTGYYSEIRVIINNAVLKVGPWRNSVQGTFTDTFSFTGLQSNTFTIDVYVRDGTTDSDDSLNATLNTVYVYTSADDYGVLSKNLDAKYIPPGAEGSVRGLLLNYTKVLVGSYNLSTGTVKFWLKWDGTTGISITDNIGIDANGNLYVKSSSETYTATGVTIPRGVYVPVVISWESGYGYIMINSTVVKLNWAGNFIMSEIGDYAHKTSTIIDEFLLTNTFISEQYASQLTLQDTFKIMLPGKTITVTPDGGNSLPTPLTISYYSSNDTLLGTSSWYGSESSFTAPNNTSKIILSSSSLSTVLEVSALDSDVAFTSSDAKPVVEHISILPQLNGVLVVKNAEGKIIYAGPADSDVTGVLGAMYYVAFKSGETTIASGWFKFTGEDITLMLKTDISNATGVFASAWAENGTLKLEMVNTKDAQPIWNVSVTYYSGDKKLASFHVTENTQHYIAAFIPPSGADTAVVKVSGVNYTKTMAVYLATNNSQLVPDAVFPWWLLMGLFGIAGLLIAPVRYKFIAPLLATAILGFAGLAKTFFTTPAWLIGTLMGLSVLSFIIYRPSSRGGVV